MKFPALLCNCATLIAALATTPVSALDQSHDGTGQAVLLPYYSAEQGRATIVSVTNHADQPKAVSFVVAEGRNGRAALAFNIYLSARDSWTGALIGDSGAGARLVSNDESCTVPALPAGGVALRNVRFTGDREDNLGADVERLQRGLVEVVELGTLSGTAASMAQEKNCTALVARFVGDGVWLTQPNADVERPAGGISADAQVVDVAAGVAFDMSPFVIDDFSAAARHGSPATNFTVARLSMPTLEAGQSRFVVGGDAFVAANRPADAMSALFTAAAVEGAFALNPDLDASTEWIVTLPTRQAYLDNRAGGELPVGNTTLAAPFNAATGGGTEAYCNPVTWETIERDGHLFAAVPGKLCYQVESVTFAATNANSLEVSTQGAVEGRMRLGLRPDVHRLPFATGSTSASTAKLLGLPVVVQPLIEVRNQNAQPGVLASYAFSGSTVRTQERVVE
jgi:hypothetical protein